MYKPNMTATVAALLIATAPLAYAQQTGTASHDPTVAAPNLSGIIQPDQIRASKIIGSGVYDVQNRDIGKVTDVILNRDGRVAAVVVGIGAFLGQAARTSPSV